MEKLLTTKALCEHLSVSSQTLRNWRKEGKLTPIKIGNRVLYEPEDIRSLCARSKEKTHNY